MAADRVPELVLGEDGQIRWSTDPDPVPGDTDRDERDEAWCTGTEMLTLPGGTEHPAHAPPRIAHLEVRLPAAETARALAAGTRLARAAPPPGTGLVEAVQAAGGTVAELAAHRLTARPGTLADYAHRYLAAIDVLLLHRDQLEERSLLTAHRVLHDGLRDGGGQWRTGPGPLTERAPDPARIPALVADLVAFARREDIVPVAHAALCLAQFATIRPFATGNDLLGRALAQAVLARHGLLTTAVPLSAALTPHGLRRAGDRYRAGELAPVVARMADAVDRAVDSVDALAAGLAQQRQEHDWCGIRARGDSAAWRLLEVLEEQPVVSVNLVAARCAVSWPAARRAIARLVDAGVLEPATGQRRNQTWLAPGLARVLEPGPARNG